VEKSQNEELVKLLEKALREEPSQMFSAVIEQLLADGYSELKIAEAALRLGFGGKYSPVPKTPAAAEQPRSNALEIKRKYLERPRRDYKVNASGEYTPVRKKNGGRPFGAKPQYRPAKPYGSHRKGQEK